MKRLLKLSALSVVLCLLQACATAPSIGIEDPGAKIAKDSGMVAVRVVSNAESLGGPLTRWNSLFVVPLQGDQTGEPLFLPELESALSSSSVFVGALPPGKYRLAALQSYLNTEDTVYRSRAYLPGFLGSFEVKINQLTDLGTLIAQRLETVREGDQRLTHFAVTRASQPSDLATFVAERVPDKFAKLGPERIGFEPDVFAPLRQDLERLIKDHGLPRSAIRLKHADADLLAFGRLGRVHVRNKAGVWAGQDLPSATEVFAAAELKDGSVLLAGEAGSVLASDPSLSAFSARSVIQPDSTVFDLQAIDTANGSNIVIAMLMTRTDWLWYASADQGRTWVKEFSRKRKAPGFFFSVNFPKSLSDGAETRYSLEKEQLTRSAAGTWTASPSKVEYVDLIQQSNGWVIARPYNLWSGVGDTLLSKDVGKTWLKTGEGGWSIGKWPEVSYVFDDGSFVMPGKQKRYSFFGGWRELAEVSYSRLYQNGKSVPLGALPAGCDRVRAAFSTDAELYALCRDGRLLMSRDQGARFELDFDPTLTSRDTDPVVERHLKQLVSAGKLKPEDAGLEGRPDQQ